MYFDCGGVDRASRLHGFYRLPGNAGPYLLPRSWIDDPSQAVGAVAWASDSVGGDGNGHNPARQASMEIHASCRALQARPQIVEGGVDAEPIRLTQIEAEATT